MSSDKPRIVSDMQEYAESRTRQAARDAGALRALTVKQPLAWAIVNGHKDIENRSWRFPYPMGTTIAIHAGRKVVDLPIPLDVPDDFARGAIVGFADVESQHAASECKTTAGFCSPWAYADQIHWRLTNPRLLDEPIPTRGYLWLFVPPPDVTARLVAALRG